MAYLFHFLNLSLKKKLSKKKLSMTRLLKMEKTTWMKTYKMTWKMTWKMIWMATWMVTWTATWMATWMTIWRMTCKVKREMKWTWLKAKMMRLPLRKIWMMA